jgi:hypothetical protein
MSYLYWDVDECLKGQPNNYGTVDPMVVERERNWIYYVEISQKICINMRDLLLSNPRHIQTVGKCGDGDNLDNAGGSNDNTSRIFRRFRRLIANVFGRRP